MVYCTMSLKNIAILCLFLLTTGVAVWLINWPPSQSIETLVTETHKQISNLNIDVQKRLTGGKKSPKDNINLDSYHLELLGFSATPRLYPKSIAVDVVLPVIVTVATVSNYERTVKVVDSVQRHLQNHTVVIYDLGLGSYELVKLKKRCNSTDVCVIRLLDYLKFPRHLKDYIYMRAYQPIVLQEALNTYGAVIWISADDEDYFQTDKITDVLRIAERVGIAAWTLDSMDPTSAFTHPGFQHQCAGVVPLHGERSAVEFPCQETPDFISPDLWTLISLHLNTVENKMCGLCRSMHEAST